MATSQHNVIKAFMEALDKTSLTGKSAVDAAIKACTNSKFSTAQEVIDQMVSDCSKASSADDFLKNYCGIILDNDDTGAVTGSDMGGSQTKTAESIVPENGSLKRFTGDSFSTNGLNFKLSYVYDTDYDNHAKDRSYSNLTDSQKFIWQGLYTWWGSESLKLIANSYGSNFGFGSSSSASVNDMHVGFYSSNDDILAYVQSWIEDDKVTCDLDLMVNMYYYNDVDTSDRNGSSSTDGAGYLDRTLAHELTHAVMGANITNFGKLPAFIKEGMAELTHGIDDERYYSIEYLAKNSSVLSDALNVNASSTSSGYEYAGGYMFLHYLAKQLAGESGNGDDTMSSANNFTQGSDYYINTESNVTLKALGGNDIVNNYGADNVKVYGNADDDYLIASGKKVTLSGDSGEDSLRIFKDATSFKAYGGSGNDIIYGGGTKSTLSGGSGNDKIILTSDDVKIRAIGGSGNDYFLVHNNSSKPTISGGSGKDSIYSGATKASLSGGSGNDYFNIYYGSTNTTINGGKGNDTIQSYSSSKTTYVYKEGDGKDVISGFNFGTDRIKLTSGSITKKSYSGNDVTFKIGTGSIKIKNGRGQKITFIDANGETKTYKVGTTKSSVSELWFDDSSSKNNSDIYGQSLSNITNSVVQSSSLAMIGTEEDLTSAQPPTSTGPITPTKYVIYANKDKI